MIGKLGLLQLLFLFFLAETSAFDGKIIGGNEVNIQNFPYMLSLRRYRNHVCSAVIIGKNVALTAAHCTFRRSAYEMDVRMNSSYSNYGGKIMQIERILEHPLQEFPDYDLSVLFLKEALPIGEPGCDIVRLADDPRIPPPHTKATLTGWGATSNGREFSDSLQKTEVEFIDQRQCRFIYGEHYITERIFCAGDENGKHDACQGDSGSPLVLNGSVYGIVSGGNGCGIPEFPTYFANVAQMRDWIRDVTGI